MRRHGAERERAVCRRRARAYNEANGDKVREYNRAYHAANRDKLLERKRASELDGALGRSRYQRAGAANVASGTARHGRRARQLLGSFGAVTISGPRARLNEADGTSREWRSEALPRHARMTRQVEALIAGAYLSGTNTRRVRRALGALFKGRGRQGCRQPNVAEGADGLAGMVSPFAGCRGYCSADPGWHGGAGAA